MVQDLIDKQLKKLSNMKKGYSREVEAFPFFDRGTRNLSVINKELVFPSNLQPFSPSIIKRHFHSHHLKVELLLLHVGGNNSY